jgi:hypothetical protein
VSDYAAFDASRSDMIVTEVLAGTITGFYSLSVGDVATLVVEHDSAFMVSEVRVDEAVGARVTVDVSRTTETAVTLVAERVTGSGSGDLVVSGSRVGFCRTVLPS